MALAGLNEDDPGAFVQSLLQNPQRWLVSPDGGEAVTAAHVVAFAGARRCMEALLQHGWAREMLEARAEGLTPFLLACRAGHAELLPLLAAAGADARAQTAAGESGFDLARARDHVGVLGELERLGVTSTVPNRSVSASMEAEAALAARYEAARGERALRKQQLVLRAQQLSQRARSDPSQTAAVMQQLQQLQQQVDAENRFEAEQRAAYEADLGRLRGQPLPQPQLSLPPAPAQDFAAAAARLAETQRELAQLQLVKSALESYQAAPAPTPAPAATPLPPVVPAVPAAWVGNAPAAVVAPPGPSTASRPAEPEPEGEELEGEEGEEEDVYDDDLPADAPLLVVDVSNACSNTAGRVETQRLRLVLRHFHKCRVRTLPVLPRSKLSSRNADSLADDVEFLRELERRGRLCVTPPEDYDDSYILQLARDMGGCILSNDHFRDYAARQPDRAATRAWLKRVRLSFAWVSNRNFVPNPDFVWPGGRRVVLRR